ncbi:penicillin-binding protein, 1A family [Rubellimicrobium thermophilum DSM 16684]|uniref:Penicillin-binding protein 1A n=1 Tax=Rubellimicrobium thermophilum DSM 16684 TaxID=1123069 RepID=S9QWK1_9RHOB|nr:PBP1A family penicillin-binding protein [Rubellimicrobium thermophilum]EPX85771.1 penicillin-binding protein, 1A family [Rubellimicrobium thermophilum DSM 16684]
MLRLLMSLLGGIFSMLTLGLAMAAVTLGAVFFMYGRDLPSYETLAQYSPPTISRVYSAEGRIIDEFAEERRLFTPVEDIPDLVKHAFIAAEDQNFYVHPGFDLRGMAAAFVEAVRSRGQDLRGASTITQQVMKNFLLDGSRTAERKIKEIILAIRIERAMSKDDILELYLNEIFLGQNSYGVTAAAQTYFNKPLTELAPGEAAYLAALAQRPGNLHPVRNNADAVARRNYVLRRMAEDGYITRAEAEAEAALPLRTVQSGDYPSFRSTVPPRDYFTDEIRRQLSANFGAEEFFTGGLSIRATMDPDLQVVAAHALQRALEQFDRGLGRWRGTGIRLPEEVLSSEEAWREALAAAEVPRDITLDGPWYPAVVLEVGEEALRLGIEGNHPEEPIVPREDIGWMRGSFADNFTRGDVVLVRRMTRDEDGSFIRWTLRQVPEVQGAFMAMDVNTGRVLAMQGGFSYQASVFNRATQARRQPGSAFKPFVYAAALDSGYSPASIVVDAPIEINTPEGLWVPQNASGRYYGPTPLRTGIEQSRNLMTIRLAQEIGMETVADYAERFGVYDDMRPFLANSLGAQETTLFRMVAAYAMFANGGERVEPTLVDRVQDRYGRTIYRHDPRVCLDCDDLSLPPGQAPRIDSRRTRIMNAVTAYQITSMMEGVVQRGTAARAINLPVPIAGKTGTTNEAKDVWFIGYSSNIAAGCYIGYDTPRSMGDASGGGLCAPVFQAFMQEAVERFGGGPFPVPEDCRFIAIDRFTGARLPDGSTGDNVVQECFRAGEEPVFGITYDGGFAMTENLPLVEEVRAASRNVTTATGDTAVVGPNASFGTLSSGGLY